MKIAFLIKEGIVSLKRARVSAFVTILSISLSLSLIGIFGLVGQNVKDVFLRFYKEVQLEVFLDPSLSASRIDQLKNRISQNVQVDDVIFISREQALEEFRKTFGEDLKGILSENPLPPSFRVIMKPSYSSPDIVDSLTRTLSGLPGVEDVLYQKEIINFIHKYFSLIILLIMVLAIVLLVVVTILIFNTIRLTISARKDIISIMGLVGATNLFIKSPFIVEGIIQGLVGGAISAGILWLLIKFVQALIFPQLTVLPHLYLLLVGMGLLLGWAGSYMSVNKYLKY